MKEIIYPKYEEKHEPSGEKCQVCGNDLYYGIIPCPDGKEGCLVLHYGYRCNSCGRIYQ